MTSRPLFLSFILLVACAQGCIFSEDFGSSGGSDSDDGLVIVLDMAGDEDLDAPDTPTPLDPCAETSCNVGETCVDGECKCGSGGTCADGAICVLDECRVAECVEGVDAPAGVPVGSCMPGQVCENFVCVPVECQVGDSTCEEGFVCDAESNTCKPGCKSDDECPGANSACVEGKGVCVDLLSDSKNCGVVGVICDQSDECMSGVCACGGGGLETRNVAVDVYSTDRDVLLDYPKPFLLPFLSPERVVCVPKPGDEAAPCIKVFSDDYALDKPHYMAVAGVKRAGANVGDQIVVRVLDGLGNQLVPDVKHVGDVVAGERYLTALRSVDIADGETKLFALWRANLLGTEGTRITSYSLFQKDGNVELVQDRNKMDQPVLWQNRDYIVDFDVALGGYSKNGVAYGGIFLPVVYAPENDFTRAEISLGGAVFNESDEIVPIVGSSFQIGETRQFARGFGTSFVELPDGKLQLHATLLSNMKEGTIWQNTNVPSGYKSFFYNRYVFSLSEQTIEQDRVLRSELSRPLTRSVGQAIVNFGDSIALAFGARDQIPAPFISVWDAADNVLFSLGWSRQRNESGSEDISTLTFSALDPMGKGFFHPFPQKVSARAIYDSTYVVEQDLEPKEYIYRLDSNLDSSGGLAGRSRVNVAQLFSRNDLQLGNSIPLTPELNGRRISVVPGPHATGLLVATQDAAKLFFVVDGDRPVCKPVATP